MPCDLTDSRCGARAAVVTLGVLACLLLSLSGISAGEDLAKVTRYELLMRIDPAEESLTATAQMTLFNPTAALQREIPFLLYRLLAVDSAEDEKGVPLAFKQTVVSMSDDKNWQVNALILTLREPLPPGSSMRVTLKYSGAIFGYSEVMGCVHDHIGEDYTLLRPDALAYPMLAQPSFQSLSTAYDSLFTYGLEITVPNEMVVACGGLPGQISQGDHTRTFLFKSRMPTWRMDIAAAKFKIVKNEAGNLAIYVLPEDEARAATLLSEMERVISFYALRFGPSEKASAYTVIEIPDGWGSQASDLYIMQDAAAFRDPKRVHELYHEIGHSWNAKASPEVRRTRWFDEAFASYFEALSLRQFSGQQAFGERMTLYREKFRNAAKKDARNATTPIAEYGKEELGGNSYTKGAWSLYVLNQIVGDETFNSIIRTFLAEFSDHAAGFADFQAVAERISKRDLSRFFKEWIFSTESSELLLGDASLQKIVERYRQSAAKE